MRRVFLVAGAYVAEAIQHALIVKNAVCVYEILDESGLLIGGRGLRRLRQVICKRELK